jgi:hypothetical protein
MLTVLSDADSYRAPTSTERAEPGLRCLYQLNRHIFRLRHRARGASIEAQRFWRDAAQPSLAAYYADFLRSAEAYRQQVLEYHAEISLLIRQRQALMQTLWQKAGRSTAANGP